MNKQELAAHVAKEAGITAAAAQKAIDACFEGISVSLTNGDDVRLVGFGTFTRARREAREGRNPQTGKALKIAASFQAKFKAGKALKDSVNGTKATKAAPKKAATTTAKTASTTTAAKTATTTATKTATKKSA